MTSMLRRLGEHAVQWGHTFSGFYLAIFATIPLTFPVDIDNESNASSLEYEGVY